MYYMLCCVFGKTSFLHELGATTGIYKLIGNKLLRRSVINDKINWLRLQKLQLDSHHVSSRDVQSSRHVTR